MITYGIGGPALFLTNESAGKSLLGASDGPIIAYAFLAGVAIQVTMALLYKTAMWHLYMGELDPEVKTAHLHRFWAWFSEKYWIEFASDAGPLRSS